MSTDPATTLSAHLRVSLNAEQLAVVSAADGPLLVVAGAGSGKTRAVTYRVAQLLERGVHPEEIVLLTFTNKAAREMLHRVDELVGASGGRVFGGTFHRIANQLLRPHAHRVGYTSRYSILDREDARDLLEAAIQEVDGRSGGRRLPKAEVVGAACSYAANTRRDLGDVLFARWPQLAEHRGLIDDVVVAYARIKRERDAMDYDDLLVMLLELLSHNHDVLTAVADRFRHVLVDEYQDTNQLQAVMVDLLSSVHGNVMAVGDDAQSIYAFRGADATNILGFLDRYEGARLLRLETNYRSTPDILELANATISFNRSQHPKSLRAVRSPGVRPALVSVRDPREQAQFIVNRVFDLIEQEVEPAQIAVLYRSHFHSLELQMELSRRRIAYDVRSGQRFFESAHVKDVLAYLQVVANPRDELSWRRVLRLLPRVGVKTAQKAYRRIASQDDPLRAVADGELDGALPRSARVAWDEVRALFQQLATDKMSSEPAEMIRCVLMSSYTGHLYDTYENADTRLEDLNQLAMFAVGFSDLTGFLSELALADSDSDAGERDRRSRIVLSTVHQAKGLEWRFVFVPWLTEGRFPSTRSLRETDGEEEERRLFYVAVTRCRDELYLCHPEQTLDEYRQTVLTRPSRFLLELPTEALERWSVHDGPVTEYGIESATDGLSDSGEDVPAEVDESAGEAPDRGATIVRDDEFFNDLPYPDDEYA